MTYVEVKAVLRKVTLYHTNIAGSCTYCKHDDPPQKNQKKKTTSNSFQWANEKGPSVHVPLAAAHRELTQASDNVGSQELKRIN